MKCDLFELESRPDVHNLKLRVCELEDEIKWKGPLVEIGIAVRMQYLAIARTRLFPNLLGQDEVDSIKLAEYVARSGNGLADEALFLSGALDPAMWAPVFTKLYKHAPGEFADLHPDLRLAYNCKATSKIAGDGESHSEHANQESDTARTRFIIKCAKQAIKRHYLGAGLVGCAEMNTDEEKDWRLGCIEAQARKLFDAEHDVDVAARMVGILNEVKMLKLLVDVGVAVRKSYMSKLYYSIDLDDGGEQYRVLTEDGDKAAGQDDIDADAAVFLGGFWPEDIEIFFSYAYSKCLSSYRDTPVAPGSSRWGLDDLL